MPAQERSRQEQGDWGEQVAERFLRQRGWRVLARNWRSPQDRRDELDLVCQDGSALVFVEVKTRAASALVPGYHAVDARKKAAVRRAATAYLRALRVPPVTFRFDVVEVTTGGKRTHGGPGGADAAGATGATAAREAAGEPEVRHFEQVPLFGKHFRV